MKRVILSSIILITLCLFSSFQVKAVNTVTVEMVFCCGGLPDSIQVTLEGINPPYQTFFSVSDTTGIVVFDSVVDGYYDLTAYKPGYQQYKDSSLAVYNNLNYSIVLNRLALPPQYVVVNPLTSVLTWDDPKIVKLLKETFENNIFPPDGWQSSSLGVGWYRSDNAGTGSWSVPPGDGYYAVSNDNAAGASNNASSDYMITPVFDLSDCISYKMDLEYFFDASNGQKAYVEYSFDNGVTWEIIDSLDPVTDWTNTFVDLTFLSGPGSQSFVIAFHADDNGGDASGLCVDNIKVENFPNDVIGYYIYLNDMFVAQVPADYRSYIFEDLVYGQTYYAGVRSLVCCGAGNLVGYMWESTYLHPPRNLSDNYIYGTDSIPLIWNPPLTGTIPMAATFKTVYSGSPKQKAGAMMDEIEEVAIVEFNNKNNRFHWWEQFHFLDFIATGEAGCETDGEFIYTVLPNSFVKYDIDGNLIEQFSIPGVSNIKDLAFDGEFFYGAAADPTVFVMDFNAHTLVTSFIAPTDIRAIAYNDIDNTFYGNNWGTNIVNFDASGNNLGSFTPVVNAIYGLAFDMWSLQGVNTLWAYDQVENNIIQLALPDGEPTGFVIDVERLVSSNGLAGGLFTCPGLYEDGKVTIGGNAQDNKVWGIELSNYNNSPQLIPDGLETFNIYQDGSLIANIPYESQAPNEWVTYIDEPVMAGSYEYCVGAIYDLTSFGFPGEIAESQLVCGDTVEVVAGSVIPFFEDWDNGTFSFNNWTLDENSANWSISSQEGEPAPSAEFTWDPLLENDYTSTLTSYPIIVDYLTEGDLYLSFDLKLIDRNTTSNEHMMVEIYDGTTWYLAADFSNDGSKTGFTNHLINITPYTTGNAINIRFNASGQNSFDIISWFVDNINVYRECAPPENLTGDMSWLTVLYCEVCWDAQNIPMPNISVNNNTRDISGFNIYRMADSQTEYQLYDFEAYVSGQTEYCYEDMFIDYQTGYFYKVTAQYISETDECESVPAMAYEIPSDDFVYLYPESIDENNNLQTINVFPIPATQKVNIVSKSPIISISITNLYGQSVYTEEVNNSHDVTINTSLFPQGVYLIQIETSTGITTKKAIINR